MLSLCFTSWLASLLLTHLDAQTISCAATSQDVENRRRRDLPSALAHEQAMKVLEQARRDSDGYVATLGFVDPCEQVRGMQPFDSAFPVLGAKPRGIFMRCMIRGDRFGVCLLGGASDEMSRCHFPSWNALRMV